MSAALDTVARLERALSPADSLAPVTEGAVRDAAVLAIFRIASGGVLELLMIERASYEGDPWSGHIALPGGRREPQDGTLLDTAIRETFEETAIDVRENCRVLGALERLRPMSPSLPPLAIAPFVALLTREAPITLSDEVASAFWVPLATFTQPEISRDVEVAVRGGRRTVRAFVHGRFTIWGLTERILRDLLARLE